MKRLDRIAITELETALINISVSNFSRAMFVTCAYTSIIFVASSVNSLNISKFFNAVSTTCEDINCKQVLLGICCANCTVTVLLIVVDIKCDPFHTYTSKD